MRPLLLLDFDGPLNPRPADGVPPGYERHAITEGARTWQVLLHPRHGAELNALADTFDLVWATSWEHGANRLLSPLLGLPTDLPTILWPDRSPVRRGSWKTPYVADWVGDRPFVWVDDELDRPHLEGLAQPHLLYHVDPQVGLTTADFASIHAWSRKPFADKAFPSDP
jgi:hypothetical protein